MISYSSIKVSVFPLLKSQMYSQKGNSRNVPIVQKWFLLLAIHCALNPLNYTSFVYDERRAHDQLKLLNGIFMLNHQLIFNVFVAMHDTSFMIHKRYCYCSSLRRIMCVYFCKREKPTNKGYKIIQTLTRHKWNALLINLDSWSSIFFFIVDISSMNLYI